MTMLAPICGHPRWQAGLVGALVLLLGGPAPPALAHANLTRSDPAADVSVTAGPERVRLSFSEALDPAGSGLTVLDSTGARVDLDDPAITKGEKAASVGVGPLGTGVYTVAWSSRSDDDGHDLKGFYAFAIGSPRPTAIASLAGPNGGPPNISLGDLDVQLAAPPTTATNALEVTLAIAGQPLLDAQRVTIRLTFMGADLGVSAVTANPQGDGRYVATTLLPSLPGTWQADVRIRQAGLDDVSAIFTIQTQS